ncbi:MAG: hypothetical protein ACKN9T_17090 [Candidatus Methylumidiphilus sp.]
MLSAAALLLCASCGGQQENPAALPPFPEGSVALVEAHGARSLRSCYAQNGIVNFLALPMLPRRP